MRQRPIGNRDAVASREPGLLNGGHLHRHGGGLRTLHPRGTRLLPLPAVRSLHVRCANRPCDQMTLTMGPVDGAGIDSFAEADFAGGTSTSATQPAPGPVMHNG